MPRSSKASLSDETIQELESQFYEFLNSLSSDERKKFFAEFLTQEEKMMMYKRLALYWCLLEGYSLAKIQQMIGVTHDTTRVYNKRKNTLSEDFKNLVGRIGKSDMADLETKKEETIEEVKVEKPEVDQSVNLNPDAPIETRPIDEPMEEKTVEEKMNEMSGSEDVKEESVEKETEIEMKDEEKEEVKEELTMDAMPNFEDEKEDKKEDEDKPAEGLMPEQPQEQQASDSEEKNENEGEEKKKSGLAKFFGF